MVDGSWPMPVIRSASFCTGIGGWELATDSVGGFEHAFVSEIEPFPCAVLAHRWPELSNFGDLTQMDCTWWRGRLDAVWGSCPCQAFSFAGRRRGMKDKRGALTLAFLDRVDEIDPTYVLYENVKGILSDKSNAFGCLLGALAGEDGPLEPPGGKWSHAGYVLGPKRTIAWRLFDAQHGGVPQRRERVFVVGSTRDGADPRDILFEREGVRRDTPPRKQAAKNVADAADGGVVLSRDQAGRTESGRSAAAELTPFGCDYKPDLARPLVAPPAGSRWDIETETVVVNAIGANGRPRSPLEEPLVAAFEIDLAPHAFDGRQTDCIQYGDMTGPLDTDGWTIGVAYAIQERAVAENPEVGPDGGGWREGVGYTLEARASVQSVAYSMMPQNSGKDFKARQVDVLQPLMAGGPVTGNQGGDVIVEALSVALRGRDEGSQIELGDEVANSLRNGSAGGGSRALALIIEWADQIKARVRRLTPLECERLQGLPDNHTRISWRGKHVLLCPDGPRYKAIGNGLAIPDVRWIALRLQRFHAQKLRELGRAA